MPVSKSIYLLFRVSVYLAFHLPIHLSTYLPNKIYKRKSTYLSIFPIYLSHPSIYLSAYLSIHLSTFIFICVYLPFNLFIHLSSLSQYLSLYSELYKYCLSLFPFWSWFRVVFLVVMRMSEPRLQVDLLHCKPKYTPE